MDHSEFEELLSAYADGESSPAQREAIELHLVHCPDCQRALAEFRLVGKRLALLAAPIANHWEPDVATQVATRIRRRRRWAIGGRWLVVRAAGMLAAGAVLIGAIWLLRYLPDVPAGDGSRVSAPVVTRVVAPTREPTHEPTAQPAPSPTVTQVTADVTPLMLRTSDDAATLYLLDAAVLLTPPAQDALCNLGFRLGADGGDVYVMLQIGKQQIALSPASAPSIYLPADAQPGDRAQIFAATRSGTTTSAAEFTLEQRDGGWYAMALRQSVVSPALQVALPTPAPEVVDLFQPTPLPLGPEVSVRLEGIFVAPEHPRQGEPFTMTAVIRNLGDEDANVPVWFGIFLGNDDPYPTASNLVYYLAIPAGKEAGLSWDGQDQWQRNRAEDLTREHARLVFRAGVNVLPPGGYPRPVLFPETDKLDNQAELAVNFLPYQPQVSDACPSGDNLWLELDQGRVYQDTTRQSALHLIVHNDGNVEVVRVPLRITDAVGDQYLAHARWVPPCGGTAIEETSIPIDRLTYPLTVTLNPPDAPDTVPESDRSDNTLVVGEYAACAGDTDLWLTADDVTVDGEDLLVTVHLSGQAPGRSFSVRVYHTADGRLLGSEQVSQIICEQPLTLRFEGILAGLSGGFVLVEINTEIGWVEPVYPQLNNSAIVPLP